MTNPHNSEPAAGDLPAHWRMPDDVPGWLTEIEARTLARLAAGQRVLEIGSYCGRSTIAMAQVARRVCAIDPFDARATVPGGLSTAATFRYWIERYRLQDRVDAIAGTSADVLTSGLGPALGVYGLVFIDGDHSAAAVLLDAELAWARLARGGLLAFHDYRLFPGQYDGRWDPGVTHAVGELRDRGFKLLARAGTVAVLRPPFWTTVPTGPLPAATEEAPR